MYVLEGTIVVQLTCPENADLKAAIEVFYDTHGCDPATINGVDYVGKCDTCHSPVLADTVYSEGESSDDALICGDCFDKDKQGTYEGPAEDPEDMLPSEETDAGVYVVGPEDVNTVR